MIEKNKIHDIAEIITEIIQSDFILLFSPQTQS